MIAIASTSYDPDGARVFRKSRAQNVLGIQGGSRRATRTATLDGGCWVYDTGYTDSDRTIMVHEKNPSREAMDFARHIVTYCPEITVSATDGFYLGVPKMFRVMDNDLRIEILITERIA